MDAINEINSHSGLSSGYFFDAISRHPGGGGIYLEW